LIGRSANIRSKIAGGTLGKVVYEIRLPPGFAVDDLPEPMHVDPNIATDPRADQRKLERVIAEDENANAVLNKAP